MDRIILLILGLATLVCYSGQSLATGHTLSGYVVDDKDRPIEYASVLLLGHNIGDVSDSTGFFQISGLASGRYDLQVTMMGYEPTTVSDLAVDELSNERIFIRLRPKLLQMPGVEIQRKRLRERQFTEASDVAVEQLDARTLAQIPGTFDDPIKAAQIFSGAGGVNDFSGFLAIRGSSPEQNVVVVDGLALPNPYRFRLALGGGMSIINPNTTESVLLHMGGFSAAYGNSLSSVLEVQTRSGNLDEMHYQGGVNLTDMNAVVEGPLPGVSGSFLLSARRTYYDLIINQFAKQENAAFPFFSELSGKWNLQLGDRDGLAISFSRNGEGTNLENELSSDLTVKEDVKTYVANIGWSHQVSQRMQLNTSLSYYNDRGTYAAFGVDTLLVYYWSDVDQAILDSLMTTQNTKESLDGKEINANFRQELQIQTGDNSWLNFGISGSQVKAKTLFESPPHLSFVSARTETPAYVDFEASHFYYAGFVESNTKANDNLHLRLGLRYDYSSLMGVGRASPRLTIWYQFNEAFSVDGSWGYFYQYPNPAAIYSRNFPIDLSIGLGELEPEKAVHHLIGIERSLGQRFQLRAQFYSNELSKMLLPIYPGSAQAANTGEGRARGFEIVLQKNAEPSAWLSGLLTYSYGQAGYRQAAVQGTQWHRQKYDRRHALTGYLNLHLSRRWYASLFGQYSSGLPYTDVTGIENFYRGGRNGRNWHFSRGELFAAEFPAFKKLDIRLGYRTALHKKGLKFYLDFVNVTNEQNLAEITWERRTLSDGRQKATRRRIYMLPRLVSFGVGFSL